MAAWRFAGSIPTPNPPQSQAPCLRLVRDGSVRRGEVQPWFGLFWFAQAFGVGDICWA
jgi:hypothetical protein